ncbi:Hypothetical predicted protein [Paramuricea clavata]|nr:Hypothetical predicted protein [Paramuricea clavata]
MEIAVEFTPTEWRYYYDCIRIHCQSNENLIVPLHGYPALNLSDFPRKLDFGRVAVGESEMKNISLKSDVPVDFEYKINLLQSIPAIQVEPRQGVIPGIGSLDIKVTFSPTEFCTVHSKLQLLISQFNASPRTCHITGCSAPGLKLKLLETKNGDIGQHSESSKRTTISKPLDPASIDPLYRSRLKKQGKPQQTFAMSDKNEEIIRNGIRFPKNLVTPSAVSYVLQQQPGKLKAKDVRQAVKEKKDIPLSTKQLKETVFEYKVQQNITEERQNQLRWCVKLGEDEISQLERNRILEERSQGEREYKIQRGDPIADVEFDRSSTNCSQQRIHRQANMNPEYTARFDFFVNDDWTRRHRVLRRFIQAGRKVIVRRRATRYLESLHQNLTDSLREGSFFQSSARTHRARSVDDNVSTTFLLKPQMVTPFSFPMFAPADEKDDGIANPIGTLPVEPTVVHIEPYIPFFKLKVPQQYTLLGYNPHGTQLSVSGHTPRNVARPLRTGAEVRTL